MQNVKADEHKTSSDSRHNDLKEIKNTAAMIRSELVPVGETLEVRLINLELKWNRLVIDKFRKNLVSDVQSLVRDNLRKMLRMHRVVKISRKAIEQSAAMIISGTPALQKLGNREALYLYIQLYMVQLLINIKPEQINPKFK